MNKEELKKEVAFTLKKSKDKAGYFMVELNYQDKKTLLSQLIQIKPRYVFAIEDWKQFSKRPFTRLLLPTYMSEITHLYDELSEEVRAKISDCDFNKLIIKKIRDKEDKNFKEIRFAFRKEGSKTNVFTFFNIYEYANVIAMMGVRVPLLKAWYTSDLYASMVESKLYVKEEVERLFGNEKVESRATDKSSYYELEEMNYEVLIEEVVEKDLVDNPKGYINYLVNKVLISGYEGEEVTPIKFDINDYEYDIYRSDSLKLDFSVSFVEAYKEAR